MGKLNWNNLNEQQNVEVAQLEYPNDGKKYKVGTKLEIGKKKDKYGYVADVQHDSNTGLDAYVVVPNKEDIKHPENAETATVLYQGSSMPVTTMDIPFFSRKVVLPDLNGVKDWFENDLPIADKIMNEDKVEVPETKQLKAASTYLNKNMDKYKNAEWYVYGQSLGSMNGQYAVANTKDKDTKRIAGAWLYEGPNVFLLLDDKQKKTANKLKAKIFNYIDPKDVVPLGYENGKGAVGMVSRVSSVWASNPIAQHMWGGYRYKDGKVITTNPRVAKLYGEMYQLSKNAGKMGSLSNGEKIFLDYEQASIIGKSIKSTAESGTKKIKKSLEDSNKLLEANYEALKSQAQAIGSELSSGEIRSAMDNAGGTKHQLVISPQSDFDHYKAQIDSINNDYGNVSTAVESSILQVKEKEASVGRLFDKYGI